MEKGKYKFVIIGAGVSGLSTAFELSEIYHDDLLILEKDLTTGGLCRTVEMNNSLYDLGSHRIHYQVSDSKLNFIAKMCDDGLLKNTRGGKLKLRNSYISYPIKLLQFLLSLGFFETLLCGFSLLIYRFISLFISSDRKNSDYKNYLIYKAGKRAYKIFYEHYAVKVWGLDPETISITAVKKRVSMTKPIQFIKDVFLFYFKKNDDRYYYYPKHGIGDFSKGLDNKITENKSKIITGVTSFELSDNDDLHLISFSTAGSKNYEIYYDTLVSTIPIDDLVMKLCKQNEIIDLAGQLRWRGLRLVYVHVNQSPLLAGETFYFPEIKYIFARVSVPVRFSETMQAEKQITAFVCEIPCTAGDETWSKNCGEIYERCLADLKKVKLIPEQSETVQENNFIIDLPKVYPVYVSGWQRTLNSIFEYLKENHKYVFPSGKCGFFLHCNMDHSIEIGQRLSRHIIEGREPSSWYDNIEEFHNLKLRD